MSKLRIPDILGWGNYRDAKRELDDLKSPQTSFVRRHDPDLINDVRHQETLTNIALAEARVATFVAGAGLTVLCLVGYIVATAPTH